MKPSKQIIAFNKQNKNIHGEISWKVLDFVIYCLHVSSFFKLTF